MLQIHVYSRKTVQEITFFVVRYAFAEKKIPWPALLGGILTDPQVMLQNLIGPFTIPRKSPHLDLCCKCCYSHLYKILYLKENKAYIYCRRG